MESISEQTNQPSNHFIEMEEGEAELFALLGSSKEEGESPLRAFQLKKELRYGA